jgi:hypothetical protein
MYWNQFHFHAKTMSFETAATGYASPGAAFKLDANSMAERLERSALETGLRYDETAGTRVILRTDSSPEALQSQHSLLSAYYNRVRDGLAMSCSAEGALAQ